MNFEDLDKIYKKADQFYQRFAAEQRSNVQIARNKHWQVKSDKDKSRVD